MVGYHLPAKESHKFLKKLVKKGGNMILENLVDLDKSRLQFSFFKRWKIRDYP